MSFFKAKVFRRPKTSKLSLLGLIFSLYALYVEHKVATKEEGEEFTALCDIQQIGASCSSVFALPEGHLMSYLGLVPQDSLLDVPNAAIGAVYYFYMLALRHLFPLMVTRMAAVAAMAASLILAWRLTQIGEMCILCWTTHVLNTLLLRNAFLANPPTGSLSKGEKLS